MNALAESKRMDRRELAVPSPCDFADLLLFAVTRRTATALVLEPVEGGHRMTVEQGTRTLVRSVLDSALADATVVRLGFLAGLDLRSSADSLGRIHIRTRGTDTEVLLAVHEDERGFGAELRRIAQAGDEEPVSHIDGVLRRVGVYRIEGELGRGGMGVVYRGVHEALEKPVAIKVISETLEQKSDNVMRFLREARAASRVRHPGIVDVTDFGTLPDGRPFLVMELVDWRTLNDVLKETGPLPPLRAIHIALLVADALDAVHARGVVHRDLKPANLFLGPNDQIKICDFGAAKLISAAPSAVHTEVVSDTGYVVGTPFYMSPEQARGQTVDARTDLYALGCMLFRMLTGAVPFTGEASIDILMAHLTEPVPVMKSPFGPLPPGLVAIVARALKKDAAQRYPHAGEMVADLRRVAASVGEKG